RRSFALAVVAMGLLFWAVGYSGRAVDEADCKETTRRQLLMFFGAAFLALIFGFILPRFISLRLIHPFVYSLPLEFMLFFGEIGCIAVFLLSAASLFSRSFTERQSLIVMST